MSKQNPFNPNSVVNPTLFAGRVEQINNLLDKQGAIKENKNTSELTLQSQLLKTAIILDILSKDIKSDSKKI